MNGHFSDVEEEGGAKQNKAKKPTGEVAELFNLTDDPYEKKNLASEQPAKVKELRARYDSLAKAAVKPKNE